MSSAGGGRSASRILSFTPSPSSASARRRSATPCLPTTLAVAVAEKRREAT
jgi:hypothetical protein